MTLEERAANLSHEEIVQLLVFQGQLADQNHQLADQNKSLSSRIDELKSQLDWLKQQVFGTKSERRAVDPLPEQNSLGELANPEPTKEDSGITIAEHSRRKRKESDEESSHLRFDDSVPVEEIRVPHPEYDAAPEKYEIISEKVTHRLAQRPGSYFIKRYVRLVVKQKEEGSVSCPPAPASVLGKSIADVSFLAGLIVDKFSYHLPLYRQHQRLEAAGIRLARSTLTGLIHQCGDLLRPIHDAQCRSILKSRVLAMDETPIRAGRKQRGKMKTGYFWPIYGDQDEVVFPFSPTRSDAVVHEVLGKYRGILLSDGYAAYERYVASVQGAVHAQCWSHTRRYFIRAEDAEPELARKALGHIRDIYREERRIRRLGCTGTKKLEERSLRVKPIVDKFFAWLEAVETEKALLPSSPFTQASAYALERKEALRIFLKYPEVAPDTNHLERQIRPIALGRKNWLFAWTEGGAEYTGIFQSLLATCRLHGVNSYAYLVDVLQRVDRHPLSRVDDLTPRIWKTLFAEHPVS